MARCEGVGTNGIFQSDPSTDASVDHGKTIEVAEEDSDERQHGQESQQQSRSEDAHGRYLVVDMLDVFVVVFAEHDWAYSWCW